MHKEMWEKDCKEEITVIEKKLSYPCIAKPVDEGCSAAVVKILDRSMLMTYIEAVFRSTARMELATRERLGLALDETFPGKQQVLLEALVEQGDATHFLEITGGMLVHRNEQGQKRYEVFPPSEVLSAGDILSLEEKFLAGEGQNITPARFSVDTVAQKKIELCVRKELHRVAEILQIEGYARIDAFVKIYSVERVEVWVIEVNTLPAMTPATCIFHQCALQGYTPAEFIDQIIRCGRKDHSGVRE